MNRGHKIMEMIIKGNLLSAQCAHNGSHNIVFVWSANAAEQLEALVSEFIRMSKSLDKDFPEPDETI